MTKVEKKAFSRQNLLTLFLARMRKHKSDNQTMHYNVYKVYLLFSFGGKF